MEINKVYHGKMEEVLKGFPDNYCHSIVTDPPYGLSFMNKHWDYDVPTVDQWKEAFRVLKPGGFLLAFGGTRTYHRMVVNIEDAGFEIRDQIQWLYGSGFPKSLDISKAIDKQAGAEREVIGQMKHPATPKNGTFNCSFDIDKAVITAPTTEAAKQWEGYGTALKPANEPICVARKPVEGTVAENVLKYGCGGLNIDGCRIGHDEEPEIANRHSDMFNGVTMQKYKGKQDNISVAPDSKGRFPANVILDEYMGAELDKQSGNCKTGIVTPENISRTQKSCYGKPNQNCNQEFYGGGEGGASRFFYCPKPDRFERDKGLRNFELIKSGGMSGTQDQSLLTGSGNVRNNMNRNFHATVKPIDLMRYLVRLVTPKGGICLDPFCGSGTTLIAAKMELMNYIGIDMDESHIPLAEARIKNWNPDLYKPQELF